MEKLLVVLQNVGVFFFWTNFQWLQGLKKTWSSFCSLDKQLSNFPHPQRLPILLNIFCVYVATWTLAHCVDKWGLDLTFSEVKFTCMKMDENFSSCAPVFNKPVLWILWYGTGPRVLSKSNRQVSWHCEKLSFLCKYNAPNTDIHMTSHLKISNCILLIFKPSFWHNKIVWKCLRFVQRQYLQWKFEQ